jgi:hypothetical protein
VNKNLPLVGVAGRELVMLVVESKGLVLPIEVAKMRLTCPLFYLVEPI